MDRDDDGTAAPPAVRPLPAPADSDLRAFDWCADGDLRDECERRESAGLPAFRPDEAQAFRAAAAARYAAGRLAALQSFRASLLRRAAADLRQHWSQVHGGFRFEGCGYRWRFDLPGVLRVFDEVAGDCVAASLPGQPAELAPVAVQASGPAA